MKHIFENAIANVNAAYPSIYTKQDVVRLIEDLRFALDQAKAIEEEKPTIDKQALYDHIADIKNEVISFVENYSYQDNVQLDLGYDNQIEISFDTDDFSSQVEIIFDRASRNSLNA